MPPAASDTLLARVACALRWSLRGAGQVIFMENAATGALNLLAYAWAAAVGSTAWAVAVGALLGTVIATAVAAFARLPAPALHAGLYGFNGLLTGAGVAALLAPMPAMWGWLVLAAALSSVVTRLLERVLQGMALPVVTFPFIVTTWLTLVLARDSMGLAPLAAGVLPAAAPLAQWGALAWLHAALCGVAQVFFVDDAAAGLLFVLALALHSRAAAVLALLGSLLGAALAALAGADAAQIAHGLWGYAPALTSPALGCVFVRLSRASVLLAVLGSGLSVVLQAAALAGGAALGLPALTIAFVLATWLMLLAWRGIAPPSAPDA